MRDSRRWAGLRRTLASALGTSDLRRLELGWAAASMGGWVFFVALAVYAYDAGGAPAVALAALVRMLPAGIAAPFTGLLADRWSRRDVLLAANIARAGLMLAMAVGAATGAPLALVLSLGALFTVVESAHRPAQAAFLPWLSTNPGQLAAANALSTGIDNAGFLAGSLAAGAMIAVGGTGATFAATAGLFAAAAGPIATIARDPVPEHRRATEEAGPLEALSSGFRVVARDRSLRLIAAVLALSTLVEGAVDVLVVVVAIQLLDLGGAGVGWLNSAWGLGGLVGGAAALSLLARGRLASGLTLGALLVGAPLLLLAAAPRLGLALAMLVILGVGYALIESSGFTLLQRLTSDDVLARAFAVVESSYWLTTGVGAIVGSALVSTFGARGALVLLGACLPLAVGLRWAPLARLEAGAPVPEREFGLIRGLSIFAPLPVATLENLSRRLVEREVPAGQVVIRQGDEGTRFYVIGDGILDVSCDGGSLPPMGAGDFFGEIALLRDVRRTATVSARTRARLYALEREVFLAAVTGHPHSSRTLESTADARLERIPGR